MRNGRNARHLQVAKDNFLMNEDERQLFAKIGEIMVCMASNSNVYSYQLAEMIGDYARKVESLKVKDENGSN